MYHNKDIPLTERRHHLYREHHLLLALLALLGMSVIPSAHRSLGAIQAFTALLSAPVLALLLGRVSTALDKSSNALCRYALGVFALFAGSTIPSFWTMALARQKGAFDLISPVSVISLVLLLAVGHPLAVWMEHRRFQKTLMLALSVVLGLIAGYLPGTVNPLGLRQLFSFLPLFLAGRWVNPQELEQLLKQLWVRAAGAVYLLVLLGFSFWQFKRLMKWYTILIGSASYASAGGGRLLILAGGGLRLVQYLIALLAAVVLLSLCPNKQINPITQLSQRWYSGLFWHRSLSYLLAVFLKGGMVLTLARTGLMAVLPLLACLPQAAVLPNWLLDLPQSLSDQSAILKIKRRQGPRLSLILYLLTFLLLLSQFASAFVETGHTMTWVPDGENLYLVMMYYSRNYFINVVKTLLHTGKLVFPQWDFSIGQGANTLSVLRLNPFYLLAFLFPKRWMDYVYALYTMGQLFCASLAFSALCRKLGQKDELIVYTGSLVYAFSGFCIFTAAKHVYFITYLVLGLPLLLLGCERWLQQRRWGLFIAVVIFLFLGGYYYTWMDSILMAFYLVARELHFHDKDFKRILRDIVELLVLYLWGMACSMVVLLPSIASLFGSSRSDTLGNGVAALYNPAHYRSLLTSFVSLEPSAKNWAKLGFVGTVFLAVVLLFTLRKRELRPFKVMTVLFAGLLCLPMAGSVFNGMGYATNRWSFGIALLMAMIFVWMLPELARLTTGQQQILTLAVLVYCVLTLVLEFERVTLCSALLLLSLTAVVLLVNRLHNEELAQQIIAGATVAALMVHVGFFFSPLGLNNVDDYTNQGSGARKYSTSAEAALTRAEDGELSRAEHNGNRHNTFCLTGGKGTNSYWSVLDGNMVDYHQDFALDSLRQVYAIWSLDQRASLCALGSVKYYTSKTPDQVPYGFEAIGQDKRSGHTIFQNRYALPFGYTYRSYLSEEDYDQLTPLEKQQAILQSAVISAEDEETVSAALSKGEPVLSAQAVPWTVEETDGVEWENGGFRVKKKDGTATLKFLGKPGCETYLWMDGATYTQGSTESTVAVQGAGGVKNSDFYQENTLYYFPRSGYTYNLGYSEEAQGRCTLTFEQKGVYRAEGIQIVCLPMEDYVRDVTALGEVVLEDAKETLNGGLTGHIEVKDERLLTLSVPWSRGWTLKLNGEKAPLLQVNGMYMGTLLEPGSYEAELHYSTPGLIPGAVISVLGLLGLAGFSALGRVGRKRRKH